MSQKKMNNKLIDFGPVYYITLKDSVDRQNNMVNQFRKFGIIDYSKIIACDGRTFDYQNDERIITPNKYLIDSGHIATILSHLKAIEYWYETSSSPFAIFMEDDMNLEISNFWNFTWKDIIARLPSEWNCIQLSIIRGDDAEVKLDEKDIQLRRRSFYNWSAGSYMLTREYAKKILNHYKTGKDTYQFVIYNQPDYIPYIENVLYIAGRPYEFTLPLFVENVNIQSTFFPVFIDEPNKGGKIQINSSNFVYEWWKMNGHCVNIDELMTEQPARYWG